MWTAILLYNDAQRQKAETLVHKMVKRAVEMEGTVTVSIYFCLNRLHGANQRIRVSTALGLSSLPPNFLSGRAAAGLARRATGEIYHMVFPCQDPC